jgi:hypothetical protein
MEPEGERERGASNIHLFALSNAARHILVRKFQTTEATLWLQIWTAAVSNVKHLRQFKNPR